MHKLFGFFGYLIFIFLLSSCSFFSKKTSNSRETYQIQKLETDLSVTNVDINSLACASGWNENCVLQQKNVNKLTKLRKIVLVGDTGCRLKESKSGYEYQNCQNLQDWPFLLVATEIAKEKSDLIVHLGDYQYREQCSQNSELCKNVKDSVGYHWKSWEEDFFKPVALSSIKAPWLFVRGNHEDCGRAHAGFLHLMSNYYNSTNANTKPNASAACPENLPLEFYEFDKTVIVNWDSSSLDDRKPLTEEKKEQVFNTLIEIKSKVYAHPEKTFILVSHKPLFAFVPTKKEYVVSNMNLISLWQKVEMPSNLKFVVSGHIHNFQMTKSANFPVQIISGNGGTKLDPFSVDTTVNELKSLPVAKELGFDFFTLTIADNHYGYAVLEEQSNGEWKVVAKNVLDKNKVECFVGTKKLNCKQENP
ncbi:MAG: metallophosphoesterase [Bacteriovoracaceae bacterium]|nr:metallophosphoesterase [Bacteriovoracaceae bacterium]